MIARHPLDLRKLALVANQTPRFPGYLRFKTKRALPDFGVTTLNYIGSYSNLIDLSITADINWWTVIQATV